MKTQTLSREPTAEEIAAGSWRLVEQVQQVMEAAPHTLSLDWPLEDAGDGVTVPDEQAAAPDDLAEHRALRKVLAEAIAGLDAREQRVLVLRYGLHDGRHRTLEEVGEHVGITRERIRQIEAEALCKLRHPGLGAGCARFWRDERPASSALTSPQSALPPGLRAETCSLHPGSGSNPTAILGLTPMARAALYPLHPTLRRSRCRFLLAPAPPGHCAPRRCLP